MDMEVIQIKRIKMKSKKIFFTQDFGIFCVYFFINVNNYWILRYMKNQYRKSSVLNEAIEYQNVLYIGTFCLQVDLIKVKKFLWNKHNLSDVH